MTHTGPELDIVVISLPGARERRAHVERQMRFAAGLSFRFFDAVTGREALDAGDFARIDEDNHLLNCGRRPTPGEIGCFASHRRVWQACAASGRPVLVMEDDFTLRDNFAAAVRTAAAVISSAGFLRLQADLRARKSPVARIGEFTLARYTKPPHGSMCYALSPAVARDFVAQTRVMSAPVDVFLKKYWEHGHSFYALLPYSVGESRLHQSTMIEGRHRRPKPPRVAVARFLRKTSWLARRALWNQRHAADAPPDDG